VWYRQRLVVVGAGAETGGDELSARDGSDGCEKAPVTHAVSACGGDEIRRLTHPYASGATW
jgi:hypothetical protein